MKAVHSLFVHLNPLITISALQHGATYSSTPCDVTKGSDPSQVSLDQTHSHLVFSLVSTVRTDEKVQQSITWNSFVCGML